MLEGFKTKKYENLIKKHRALGEVENDPGKVFNVIKAKLMRFSETPMEKQMRICTNGSILKRARRVRWPSSLGGNKRLRSLRLLGSLALPWSSFSTICRRLVRHWLRMCSMIRALGLTATADLLVAGLPHGRSVT